MPRRSAKVASAVNATNIIVEVTPPGMATLWINVIEIAQFLGIEPDHAEKLLREGKIKFKWVGGVNDSVIDLDAFADSQACAAVKMMKTENVQ